MRGNPVHSVLFRIFNLLIILLFIYDNTYLAQENYINIIIPEDKETITEFNRYRLSANTLPGSEVKLNGKKLRVYSSGAFVDLMDLRVGENIFKIESTNKGSTVEEEFIIIREVNKLETTPEDSIVIEDKMMLPEQNQWLDIGDILEVRIKGTPGAQVTFLDSLEMTELPPSKTNGIEGIYTGIYKIKTLYFI